MKFFSNYGQRLIMAAYLLFVFVSLQMDVGTIPKITTDSYPWYFPWKGMLVFGSFVLVGWMSGKEYARKQMSRAQSTQTMGDATREAFVRECDDADELLRLLGFIPHEMRIDGGSINLPKVRHALKKARGEQA